MAEINGQDGYSDYLKGIQDTVFKRMDDPNNGVSNGDGKVTVNEALYDLNIASLLSGQNEADTKKIKAAADKIPDVLKQYAGEDGVFTAEEWSKFLNGAEWDSVLDAWHSSGKKAELEMGWIDNAHIQDGAITKGEVKVGILNNLIANGINIDAAKIESLIDKYAGKDGTFTKSEYTALLNDPVYKNFVNKHGVRPWFKYEG